MGPIRLRWRHASELVSSGWPRCHSCFAWRARGRGAARLAEPQRRNAHANRGRHRQRRRRDLLPSRKRRCPRATSPACPTSLAPFFDQCRLGDAALSRVAERFARRQSEGSSPLDVSEISFRAPAPKAHPTCGLEPGRSRAVTSRAPPPSSACALGSTAGATAVSAVCGLALTSAGQRSVLAAVAPTCWQMSSRSQCECVSALG